MLYYLDARLTNVRRKLLIRVVDMTWILHVMDACSYGKRTFMWSINSFYFNFAKCL